MFIVRKYLFVFIVNTFMRTLFMQNILQ